MSSNSVKQRPSPNSLETFKAIMNRGDISRQQWQAKGRARTADRSTVELLRQGLGLSDRMWSSGVSVVALCSSNSDARSLNTFIKPATLRLESCLDARASQGASFETLGCQLNVCSCLEFYYGTYEDMPIETLFAPKSFESDASRLMP